MCFVGYLMCRIRAWIQIIQTNQCFRPIISYSGLLGSYSIYLLFATAGELVDISQVATKGQELSVAQHWVSSFFLTVSSNGLSYDNYTEGEQVKVSYFNAI